MGEPSPLGPSASGGGTFQAQCMVPLVVLWLERTWRAAHLACLSRWQCLAEQLLTHYTFIDTSGSGQKQWASPVKSQAWWGSLIASWAAAGGLEGRGSRQLSTFVAYAHCADEHVFDHPTQLVLPVSTNELGPRQAQPSFCRRHRQPWRSVSGRCASCFCGLDWRHLFSHRQGLALPPLPLSGRPADAAAAAGAPRRFPALEAGCPCCNFILLSCPQIGSGAGDPYTVTAAGSALAALLDATQVDVLWPEGAHIAWFSGFPNFGTGATHCSAFVASVAERLGELQGSPPALPARLRVGPSAACTMSTCRCGCRGRQGLAGPSRKGLNAPLSARWPALALALAHAHPRAHTCAPLLLSPPCSQAPTCPGPPSGPPPSWPTASTTGCFPPQAAWQPAGGRQQPRRRPRQLPMPATWLLSASRI